MPFAVMGARVFLGAACGRTRQTFSFGRGHLWSPDEVALLERAGVPLPSHPTHDTHILFPFSSALCLFWEGAQHWACWESVSVSNSGLHRSECWSSRVGLLPTLKGWSLKSSSFLKLVSRRPFMQTSGPNEWPRGGGWTWGIARGHRASLSGTFGFSERLG